MKGQKEFLSFHFTFLKKIKLLWIFDLGNNRAALFHSFQLDTEVSLPHHVWFFYQKETQAWKHSSWVTSKCISFQKEDANNKGKYDTCDRLCVRLDLLRWTQFIRASHWKMFSCMTLNAGFPLTHSLDRKRCKRINKLNKYLSNPPISREEVVIWCLLNWGRYSLGWNYVVVLQVYSSVNISRNYLNNGQ